MEIIATNALISINETFLVQLVSFLIFLYIMNRIMFRPLLGTMHQRDEYLHGVRADIAAGRDNLDRLVKALDDQRAQVIQEADTVVRSLEAEGDQQASALIEEARQKIASLRQENEAQVNAQMKQARQAILGEVDAITLTVMENVLQRRMHS
ncbi:MAG: ATP synthase F0 subunit B [Desulfosarcina sp.]|jgi:F-type H+-transporting ATPase subunit b